MYSIGLFFLKRKFAIRDRKRPHTELKAANWIFFFFSGVQVLWALFASALTRVVSPTGVD